MKETSQLSPVAIIIELTYLSIPPQVTPHVTPQVKLLLEKPIGEMSRDEIQVACQLKDRKSFTARYLKPALEAGFIEMTIPDKPRSRAQRYRLTALGQSLNSH